jgi:uncharacterized repeat protein (TIGR02543 family)
MGNIKKEIANSISFPTMRPMSDEFIIVPENHAGFPTTDLYGDARVVNASGRGFAGAVTTKENLARHSVTFDTDGKNDSCYYNSCDVKENQILLIPNGYRVTKPANPVNRHYTFDGWYLGDTEYNFSTPVTQNITLKAKWKLSNIAYSITYDHMMINSSGRPAFYLKHHQPIHNNPETYTYGEKTILTPAVSELEEYSFIGWVIENIGYTVYDDFRVSIDSGTTGNLTILGIWSFESSTSIIDAKGKRQYGIAFENSITKSDASAKFIISTPEQSQITLAIYDNLGNLLNKQNLRTNSDGDIKGLWNLTNEAGRTVAAGSYLMIIEATGISGKRYRYSTKFGVKR